MTTTRVNAALYLTKTFFDFYAIGMPNTLRYTFPKDTIQHLDIISSDIFIQQVHSFMDTNKLPVSNICMLLSDDLLFCKELPAMSSVIPSHVDEISTFIDAVPFDNVLSKLYKLEKKELLVATNQDYVTEFNKAYRKNDSRIEDVVPAFLLGKSVHLDNGMPAATAHLILDKLGNIKPWGMPISQDPTEQIIHDAVVEKKDNDVFEDTMVYPTKTKKSSKRIILMSGSLLPLLGVFIYLFVQMNAENAKQDALFKAQQQAKKMSQVASNPQTVVAIPTNPPTSAFSATAAEQNMSITLDYSSVSASVAASIKTDLLTFGIHSITDTESTTVNSGSVIAFSPSVPPGSKQRIVNEVHKEVADLTIQNTPQLSTDVLITLP